MTMNVNSDSENNGFHLDAVIFVDDARSTSINDAFRALACDENVRFGADMTDDQLIALGRETIRSIQYLPTLVRISKVDPTLLSDEQLKEIQSPDD